MLLCLVLVSTGMALRREYLSSSSSRDKTELWDDPISKLELLQRPTSEILGNSGLESKLIKLDEREMKQVNFRTIRSQLEFELDQDNLNSKSSNISSLLLS